MSATSIKAIETVYKGYKFRSRLEARWAVFFDALGLEFVYEAEGFEMDGIRYLPDFWIPAWKLHLEIKPRTEENCAVDGKLTALHRALNGPVLRILGQPWPDEYVVEVIDTRAFISGTFLRCERCPNMMVISSSAPVSVFFLDGGMCEHREYRDAQLISAYRAARGARFEHGESPA